MFFESVKKLSNKNLNLILTLKKNKVKNTWEVIENFIKLLKNLYKTQHNIESFSKNLMKIK